VPDDGSTAPGDAARPRPGQRQHTTPAQHGQEHRELLLSKTRRHLKSHKTRHGLTNAEVMADHHQIVTGLFAAYCSDAACAIPVQRLRHLLRDFGLIGGPGRLASADVDYVFSGAVGPGAAGTIATPGQLKKALFAVARRLDDREREAGLAASIDVASGDPIDSVVGAVLDLYVIPAVFGDASAGGGGSDPVHWLDAAPDPRLAHAERALAPHAARLDLVFARASRGGDEKDIGAASRTTTATATATAATKATDTKATDTNATDTKAIKATAASSAAPATAGLTLHVFLALLRRARFVPQCATVTGCRRLFALCNWGAEADADRGSLARAEFGEAVALMAVAVAVAVAAGSARGSGSRTGGGSDSLAVAINGAADGAGPTLAAEAIGAAADRVVEMLESVR
jgi:hypothetical protein